MVSTIRSVGKIICTYPKKTSFASCVTDLATDMRKVHSVQN